MKQFGWVLKKKLKPLMVAEKLNMGKNSKIMFESKDGLPINKPIKLLLLTITVKSVSSDNGKCYP